MTGVAVLDNDSRLDGYLDHDEYNRIRILAFTYDGTDAAGAIVVDQRGATRWVAVERITMAQGFRP